METIVKDSTTVTIPTKPLLRHHQREEINQEISDIDSSLSSDNPFRHRSGPDVAEARARSRRLKKQVADYSPPELTGGAKDKLSARIQYLEEKILQGMPTQEEMRKNPAGMVGKHMRWEKANKKHIIEWKNAQIMREPDSNDPDLANFERLRPSGEMDRLRTDAQIGGHMTFSNIPEEVWRKIFPNGPYSALEQAKKVQAEQVEQAVDKVDKRKLPRSDEQKRVLAERLALARHNKQVKNEDPVSPQEGESAPFEGA